MTVTPLTITRKSATSDVLVAWVLPSGSGDAWEVPGNVLLQIQVLGTIGEAPVEIQASNVAEPSEDDWGPLLGPSGFPTEFAAPGCRPVEAAPAWIRPVRRGDAKHPVRVLVLVRKPR